MQSSSITALLSGALAGLMVDISLFPIDTVKTRLQSEAGFWKSGAFRGIYSGLGSVAVGSAPGAALFFVSYETSKMELARRSRLGTTTNHMLSSSLAEIVACLVRVPSEVIKQRSQAGQGTSLQLFKQTLSVEGLAGFYRGYASTIMREIPFSVIQFPLWELIKVHWSKQGEIEPWKSAVSGAIAGSVAASLTTPLDVAKTRIMLAQERVGNSEGIWKVLSNIYHTEGVQGLWAGVLPRVLWISIGGFIFLGVYDTAKYYLGRRSHVNNGPAENYKV
ncbi:mitochondrial S-adenosylmethionine carrier protein-like [Watersipora subatra]|uniref:mitochondrial S-adenosylmethionine carrier protein-like n=1 Tax=Watersipora subatra TaxID=2589382 RepID=UPI00355C1F0A